MIGEELDRLIKLLARLPGLGPRSARRAALYMLQNRETAMAPLTDALSDTMSAISTCTICGNLDSTQPCGICRDPRRDETLICVVEDVGDLWALERSGAFRGRYHVLGGVLSALDGIGPEQLSVEPLLARAREPSVTEVILALPATVDAQTTAHYLGDRLAGCGVTVSGLAKGVPVGGELDYLDDGTLLAALKARKAL